MVFSLPVNEDNFVSLKNKLINLFNNSGYHFLMRLQDEEKGGMGHTDKSDVINTQDGFKYLTPGFHLSQSDQINLNLGRDQGI